MAKKSLANVRVLLGTTLLYGLAMCNIALIFTSSALAETSSNYVRKGYGYAHEEGISPYEQRRAALRAQKEEEIAARTPEMPMTLEPVVEGSVREPLRVTIPNINKVQQARHPSSTIVMTDPAYNNNPTIKRKKATEPTVETASSQEESESVLDSWFSHLLKTKPSNAPIAIAMPAEEPAPQPTSIATTQETAPVVASASDTTHTLEQVIDRSEDKALSDNTHLVQPPVQDLSVPPIMYQSPGAVIKKETLYMANPQPEVKFLSRAEQLAMLTPAAGGNELSSEAPLIQAPETVPPVAKLSSNNANPTTSSSETTEATPSPPSAPAIVADIPTTESLPKAPTPPAPDMPLPTAASNQSLPASSVNVSTISNQTAPIDLSPPVSPSTSVPTDTNTPLIVRAETPEQKAAVMPASIQPLVTPVAPVAEISPAIPAGESEPKRELSSESKKIVEKLPSNIDKKKNAPAGPFNIERAKDTSEISEPAEPKNAAVKHESLGIQIQVKTPPVNTDYELEKAYNALTAGHTPTAIEIYKTILANDANNKGALFGLATAYHRAGQLDLARPAYAKLLSIDPNHRDGLNNFLVLLADEAPEDALSQMEQLESRNPQFSPIPAQMAVIYQKLGNQDKANEKMLRAMELAPENLTYRYNFAIMLDKQHKYDEAALVYRKIIEAYQRGETIPGNVEKIQQRLTFISSNRP